MNRQHIAWLATLSILVMSGCQTDEVTTMVGTLERDRVELKVESNEPIVEIAVSDGQAVEPGDLVLRQASTRAEARVAQAQAQRAQAAARLAELQRGPREESIREARANLAAARADRVNASNRLQRTREVFSRGLSSQGQLDADEALFQTSLAREQAAGEALERLLNGTTVEELRQAEATVQAADAQLELARVDLERTRVTAPVAGVVDKVLFQLGERPAPSTTVAVVLADSRAFARVYVPEEIRARLQPGDRIDVRVDGVDAAFEGRVRWVSADASFTPYFALTEHDRSRLSYLAEIDLTDAADLPSGLPLEAERPRD
jgi:HlyD family secretion protein